MNNEINQQISARAVVAVITHDETRVWLLNDESDQAIIHIKRGNAEHVHVRQAQFQHGHASEVGEVPYFNEIAEILDASSCVVLMGHGKGKANAAHRFETHLLRHSPSIAQKIAVTGTINLPALGDSQIIHEARRQWKASLGLK